MRWIRHRFTPCLPLGKDGKTVTGSAEHIELSRKAACEGMVLLKNDNSLLPLEKGTKVALFGKASVDYVKGGGGSGDVNSEFVINLCDGVTEKQSEGKLISFEPLNAFYKDNVKAQYDTGIAPGTTAEPEIPEELLTEAKNFADVAIISICRFSGEGFDRNEKDDYCLTEAEQKLVECVSGNFKNTVLILNVGGIVDSSYFKNNEKIGAVLLAWQAGMAGGLAEADILCGDVCPSGKLADTFASRISDYPSYDNFNESEDYVPYTEDIYVGYRYFETVPDAKEKVNYPFGFGLSYTDFEIKTISSEIVNGSIKLLISVKNIGNYSGKEVVQIYSSAPKGDLDKPFAELKSFVKTKLLQPGEAQELTVEFSVESMSSFDEKTASYILEKGNYSIYAGNSVRSIEKVFDFYLDNTAIVQALSNLCAPKKLQKRMNSDVKYELLETKEYAPHFDTSDWPHKPDWKFEHILPDLRETAIDENNPKLENVVEDDKKLIEMIAGMTDCELIDLVGGCNNRGVSNVFGIGDLPTYDIPAAMTADGPAGLRINKEIGISATAWPCATLLACTWNTELVMSVGEAAAKEVKENNIAMWLAPALNIHRNPLCGRNFEYYSEDPVVSGLMASAMIKGVQSQGVSSCIKHFACNNKETNRFKSDSIVSERALREIYLKGFEIAIKTAEPWAVMTSYNMINGIYSSENHDLISGILRGEWKYQGLVLSDWANQAEHYRELLAGNNLRMPIGSSKRLLKALELNLISRKDLENNVFRVLKFFSNLE